MAIAIRAQAYGARATNSMILFGERVLPEIGIVDIDAMIESSLSVEREREREGGRKREKVPGVLEELQSQTH